MADGMFGPMPGVFSQQFNMPAPTQSGGMFGGGDSAWKQAALMAIAGFMARRSPQVSSTILQGYQDKQELAQKLAAAQLERQQAMQDHTTEHQQDRLFDIANSPPPDIQDRIDVLNKVDPSLGATYARNYAANGGGMGPPLTNPLTGQQMVPAARAPVQAPPPEAISRLKANPAEAAQFDEIFGPGASAKALGGQTASPSGGFPY